MKMTEKKKRAYRYAKARAEGNSMQKSREIAGYRPTGAVMRIEKIKEVVKASETFKEAILRQITRDGLVSKLMENVNQDDDKGAKNTAIKLLADRVEPVDSGSLNVHGEKVMIVLKA